MMALREEPARLGPVPIFWLTLVWMTSSSRSGPQRLRALPSISSLAPMEYMFAVSNQLRPRSRACLTTSSALSWPMSQGRPQRLRSPKPMHPTQIPGTSSPLLPSFLYSTLLPIVEGWKVVAASAIVIISFTNYNLNLSFWDAFFCLAKRKRPRPRKEKRFGCYTHKRVRYNPSSTLFRGANPRWAYVQTAKTAGFARYRPRSAGEANARIQWLGRKDV